MRRSTNGGSIGVPKGDADERHRHLYIIGQTGTGKSTLLLNLLRQDFENGAGVALLDPHGDLARAERATALRMIGMKRR